jgi:hypothetical protein
VLHGSDCHCSHALLLLALLLGAELEGPVYLLRFLPSLLCLSACSMSESLWKRSRQYLDRLFNTLLLLVFDFFQQLRRIEVLVGSVKWLLVRQANVQDGPRRKRSMAAEVSLTSALFSFSLALSNLAG